MARLTDRDRNDLKCVEGRKAEIKPKLKTKNCNDAAFYKFACNKVFTFFFLICKLVHLNLFITGFWI